MEKPLWAVGVTCCKERQDDYLPATLHSLHRAGWMDYRLFFDDKPGDILGSNRSVKKYDMTFRNPRIRAYGNWLLGMMELVLRHPHADLFMMVQDDVLFLKNTRGYLETCRYPERGYWNLALYPGNHTVVPPDRNTNRYGKPAVGWFRAGERGKGAQALVFSQDVAYKLLSCLHTYDHVRDPVRGWQAIDGSAVSALSKQGIIEYVHHPSLVDHAGYQNSAMRLDSENHPELFVGKPGRPEPALHQAEQPRIETFWGEDYDALELNNLKR